MVDILIVIAMVFAVVAAIWLLRQWSQSPALATARTAPKPLETLLDRIDTTPDKPINFGYKNSWLAVRASNAQDVAESLSLDNLQAANWHTGFVAACNGHTFVSPPVDGWVLVVSQQLPELGHDPDTEEWTFLLQSLSDKYRDVQYFGTHRVVGYNAWARFIDGTEQRAFAYLGESGATLVDRGSRTLGESELGYKYFDPDSPDAETEAYWEREDLCYPDEEHVMEVAGKWSVNPTTLESKELSLGVGWIGSIRRATK